MKLNKSMITIGLFCALACASRTGQTIELTDSPNGSVIIENIEELSDAVLKEASYSVGTVDGATVETAPEEGSVKKQEEAKEKEPVCSCKNQVLEEPNLVAQVSQVTSKPKRFKVITITLPDDSDLEPGAQSEVKEYKIDSQNKAPKVEVETSNPVPLDDEADSSETVTSSPTEQVQEKKAKTKPKGDDRKRAKRDARKDQSKGRKDSSKQTRGSKKTKNKNARSKK